MTHTLCYDFDEDGGLLGPFNTLTVSGDASSALDETRFASPPRSATFDYGLTDDGGYEVNALTYTKLQAASEFTAEAKIFIPARPARSYETIDFGLTNGTEIDYTISGSQEIIDIGCYSPCVRSFDASSNYTSYALSLTLPTKQWVDVKIHVTLGASLGVNVTYDSVDAGSIPSGLYDIPPVQPTLFIGAAYSGSYADAFEVGIDDVTYDVLP